MGIANLARQSDEVRDVRHLGTRAAGKTHRQSGHRAALPRGLEAAIRSGTFATSANIGLGKKLSIRIVAEGIENHAQSAFLAEQGCDYGQGYLFSKAIAAADVPELLSRLKEAAFQVGSDQKRVRGR